MFYRSYRRLRGHFCGVFSNMEAPGGSASVFLSVDFEELLTTSASVVKEKSQWFQLQKVLLILKKHVFLISQIPVRPVYKQYGEPRGPVHKNH